MTSIRLLNNTPLPEMVKKKLKEVCTSLPNSNDIPPNNTLIIDSSDRVPASVSEVLCAFIRVTLYVIINHSMRGSIQASQLTSALDSANPATENIIILYLLHNLFLFSTSFAR